MSTNIAFLRDLRDDLMEAAVRSTGLMPSTGRAPGRPPRKRGPRWKLAGAMAAFVLVAGVVGYLATGGRDALKATAGSTSPRDLAGGPATGHQVPEPGAPHQAAAPQPSPAPSGPATPMPSATPGEGGPAVGPNVIKTATVELLVDRHTFVDQFEKAVAIAERYDGYVQASATSGTATKSGTMTIRVPADKFAFALGDIRVLGRVVYQEVTGQDVTAQFVDLGARLQNAEAQERSLRRLLAKAPTVDATLKVNRVLSQTQLEIEQLQGQLRVLQNRTDLGTIHLEMREPRPKVVVPQHTLPPVKNPKLGRAFDQGVAGFLGVVTSVVVGVGYLLPLLVIGLLTWFVLRRVRRARIARTARGAEA